MVVIFDLPKAATCLARKLNRRFLFERLDKFHKIACFRRSSRQNMQVIRHHTICVDEKLTSRSVFSQPLDNQSCNAWVRAKRTPIVKA